MHLGILYACIAMIGWGLGDFFIQKATRIIGIYKALFFICISSTVILFPFIGDEISVRTFEDYQSLALLSGIIFVYALFLFQALKRGKISVVESVVALELPITVGLGVFVNGESLSVHQFIIFFAIFAGVILATTPRLDNLRYHRHIFEKGVLLAFVSAFLSALTNFYIGTYSQSMSPLFVIWATHGMLAALCGVYIIVRGEVRSLMQDIRAHPYIILAQTFFDNMAWISYAYATSIISISITVMISESYIVLAALLGYFVGREKLSRHQVLGACIAFTGLFALLATLDS
ncbi:MAG: DMT family transporter [Patescibacteria group bacterium]